MMMAQQLCRQRQLYARVRSQSQRQHVAVNRMYHCRVGKLRSDTDTAERDTLEVDATKATKYLMESNPFTDMLCDDMVHSMKSRGYYVMDGLLGREVAQSLRKEVKALMMAKAAATTLEHSYTSQYDARDRQQIVYNENTRSVEPDGTEWNAAQGILMLTNRIVTSLVPLLSTENRFPELSLSKNVYGSRVDCSCTGGTQPKHVDNAGIPDTRKISVLYFMNPGWRESHGGHYRLYNGRTDDEFVEIAPQSDRLLTFWSDLQVHNIEAIHTEAQLPTSPDSEVDDDDDLQALLTVWLVAQQSKVITPRSHPMYETLRSHFPLSYR